MRLKQRNDMKMKEKEEKLQMDYFIGQQNAARIEGLRRERKQEKAKIKQANLITRQEGARQAKIKMQQDNMRRQAQLDYNNRLNAERRSRVKMDEAIAKKKMEEVRRRKLEETRIAVAK